MAETTTSFKKRIQRASRPKVRTGCITCKKRRVKCDETKPECLRCANFGCSCDGYEFQISSFPRVVPKRPLAPKRHGAMQKYVRNSLERGWSDLVFGGMQRNVVYQTLIVQDCSSNVVADRSSALSTYRQLNPSIYVDSPIPSATIYSPSTALFENEQENLYFRYYCSTTVHQISGGINDGIWDWAFLQACHEQPFVRHAIIAIAALSKAMAASRSEVNGIKLLPNVNNAPSQNPHHVFALQQYGKAVRQMRKTIQIGDENIRMALLSCLLTVCFESFHGHHENALVQIGAGLKILQDWLKKQHIPKHSTGLKSPNANIVDDQLFHSFVRLDMAAMYFFDGRSGEFHRTQSREGQEVVEQMPKTFTDLKEAGAYFSVVMQRVLHFSKWIETEVVLHYQHKQAHLGATDIETEFPHRHSDVWLDPGKTDLESYIGELGLWAAAFQPIMDRSRTPEWHMEIFPASFFKLHEKLLTIMLLGLKCDEECCHDQYLSEFTEIVSYAETILSHPSIAHSPGMSVFVFDPSTILPLLVVAIKCRDWTIRRKAITLLQANPRREGTWDSSLSAGIGLWHMTLEERGLQFGDFVPESSRVRMAGVKQDFKQRTAVLSASQVVDGETIIHETTVHW